MSPRFSRWGLALATLSFCSLAEAHPGHGAGYLAGWSHPFMGADHVLAMLAVGAWSAQLGGRARWLVPVSFVLTMALAGALGAAGVPLPQVESGIAASVLLLGLLIAFAIELPFAAAGGIVGVFALFHGYAHGAEMPPAGAWMYGLGFVSATAALHAIGLLAGHGLRTRAAWLRTAGALVAASGAWILATL